MKPIEAEILFQPQTAAQRFLPEGPYRCPDGRVSWVAIQHGTDSLAGSLNLLDLDSLTNEEFVLPGRPGFAFPTRHAHEFLIGMERSVVLYHPQTGSMDVIADDVDREVTGTIINDGVIFDGHVVFGCKDLKFAERKAGLYLLRSGDRRVIQLSRDQICSNGKATIGCGQGRYTLYDIDSPTKQVMAWDLEITDGRITQPRVVLDLTDEPTFPDGMILTPDQQGIIVAFYDPRDSDHGQARCYDIRSGELRTIWRCDRSPRVTCPQLIERHGRIQLLLTTADEGMSPDLRAKCPHAGCLFVADTEFTGLNDNPIYPVDA